MATTRKHKTAEAEEPEVVTVEVRVTPGLLVFHDGEQRGGVLQVPADVAQDWVSRGWVTAVE